MKRPIDRRAELTVACAEVDRLRLALAASQDEAEKAKADTVGRGEILLAVNRSCSCGGRGPGEPSTCPACEVWHRLFGDNQPPTAHSRIAELERENTGLRGELENCVIHLEACSSKLNSMGIEFMSPRFTDRHGDGPVMKALAVEARQVANAARQARTHAQEPPAKAHGCEVGE